MTKTESASLRATIFKKHGEWEFDYDDFLDVWFYVRERDGVVVYCTPDFEERGYIHVQVYDLAEGTEPPYSDGISTLIPWPRGQRSAESWAALMMPVLDHVTEVSR